MDTLFPVLGLLLPAAGWLIAAALVQTEGSRFATATEGLTWGLALAVAALVAVRVWCIAGGASPADVVGVTLSSPPASGDVLRAWGRLLVIPGAAVALGAIVWAPAASSKAIPRVPTSDGADLAGAVAALLLSAVCTLLLVADPEAWAVSLPLDLAASVPALGLIIAASMFAKGHPKEEVASVPEPKPKSVTAFRGAPKPSVSPDPVPVLRAAGLISSTPHHTWEPTSRSASVDPGAQRLWSAVGAAGRPPGALAKVLQLLAKGEFAGVPDVPGYVERHLLAAVVLGVLIEQAGRVFVITREPEAVRRAVAAGIESLGQLPPGALAAGPAELADLETAGRLPAAILFTASDANARGVAYLAGAGSEFARQLSALVISRPDLLHPVPATHFYFTMARLQLQWRDDRRPAALVTAHGTGPILAGVEKALGTSFERVPLRLNLTDRVTIYRGLVPGEHRRESLLAAIRDAIARLSAAGVDASVEDAADFMSAGDLGEDQTRVALDEPGTLRGDVTLIVAAEEELAPIFRMAAHRPPRGTDWGQVIVWWVMPSPIANFLLEGDRMHQQFMGGMLPAPAPLFARDNQYLLDLHLRAALHEGTPEEEKLRRAFGADEVSTLLEREKAVRGGRHAELELATGSVRRSHLLAPARGQGRPDTSRRTITKAEVRVVDGAVGTVLDRVDQLTAATHYYPYRVFAISGRRYQVRSGGGADSASRTITVDPVGNDTEPTRPSLGFAFKLKEWSSRRDSRKEDGFELEAAKAWVLVSEKVDRAMGLHGDSEVGFDRLSTSYSTYMKVVWFRHLGPLDGPLAAGLTHLARLLDDILVLHLRCRDENIEVEAAPRGFGGVDSPGLLVVDRHVGGAGVADALTLDVLVRALRWAQAVMKSCPCDRGCARCSPREVEMLGAKNEAIELLGN
jgi:hypothetical protein